MYVEYSGWSEKLGSFHFNIFLDESRQDYSIEYGDGTIVKQTSSFQDVTTDWNHDGDVYTQFGAWFESPISSGNDFFSAVDLVYVAIESVTNERRIYGNEIKAVHGLELPKELYPTSLSDRLHDAENRRASDQPSFGNTTSKTNLNTR